MIIVDTSGLIAAIDPRQNRHAEAARVLEMPQRRVLSPFVLAETDYLIERNGGQHEEAKLLRDVASGVYQMESLSSADIGRCLEIISQYSDLRLGLADASIVLLAERYRCWDILTLDERHFRVILGPGGVPFRLLPSDSVRSL